MLRKSPPNERPRARWSRAYSAPMPKNANKALLVSSAEDTMATALESDENRETMAPGKATNAAVAHAQKSVDRSADTLTPPQTVEPAGLAATPTAIKRPRRQSPPHPGPSDQFKRKKSSARTPLMPSCSQRSRREDR